MKKLDMTVLLNIKCELTNTWICPGDIVKITTGSGPLYGGFYWSYEKRGFVFKLHDAMNVYYDLNKTNGYGISNAQGLDIEDAIECDPTHLTSQEKMDLMNLQQSETNKA